MLNDCPSKVKKSVGSHPEEMRERTLFMSAVSMTAADVSSQYNVSGVSGIFKSAVDPLLRGENIPGEQNKATRQRDHW